jgi:hypothetical protein
MKICSFGKVALGEGAVYSFTLFESKYLFSIIFYWWKTIDQVRFHTHAFAAIAFLLSGSYVEDRIVDGQIEENNVNQWLWPRYLPRNYTHKIKKAAPRTLTMVITGPWQKHWYEYFEDTRQWIKYGWGREKLDYHYGGPKRKLF